MDENSKTAMIALLPTHDEWCKIDLPHLTLVFAGDIKELKPSDINEMTKDASLLTTLVSDGISLSVIGVETFGGNHGFDPVYALKFRPNPELLAMRKIVEKWNKSQYPFNPHSTIGPATQRVNEDLMPRLVRFDRVLVQMGDDSLVFNFKKADLNG